MANPSEFTITHFDSLTVEQFANASPSDAPPVRDADERITALQEDLEELGGLDALRMDLEAAEDELKEVEIQHELGEATDKDLAQARQAVEDARTALKRARRKEKAIERLKERREAALEAAQQAIRQRATELLEQVGEEAVDPLRNALEVVEEAQAILETAGRDRHTVMQSVDSDLLLFQNLDTLREVLHDHLTPKGKANRQW